MVIANRIDINKIISNFKATFSVPTYKHIRLLDGQKGKATKTGDKRVFSFYNKFIKQFIIYKVASHAFISSFSSYDGDIMPFYL